jgi:hypothetical protein
MSSAALRVLPYDEFENGSALLPTRLVRPTEQTRHPLNIVDLKSGLKEGSDQAEPLTLSRIVENNGEPPTFPGPLVSVNVHPNWLIRMFAGGVIVGAVGLILLILMPFTHMDSIGIAAASCLVIGTTTVALSLLRGQDIEGFAE